jgi:transposase
MKKVSTITNNFRDQRRRIGLDLGDRSSWCCVLDESDAVRLEQRLSTTPKAIKEVFGRMPRSQIALETTPIVARISLPQAATNAIDPQLG